jgi:hypothetical protein
VCKAVLLSFALLFFAVLPAQAANPSSKSSKNPDLTTLTGCLTMSEDNYILTEDDGETHQLSGAANKLGHQMRREIEVTGKPGWQAGDNTVQSGSSDVSEQEIFEVKTVKRVADSCSSGQ